MAGSPEELRVYLTGGVRVERGGSLIRQRSFSFPYAALAFAYFVCERGRPIPGGDLAGIFWPDTPPADSETVIRATTQKLRRALARQALGFNLRVSGRELYELDAPSDTWVDIEAAAAAIHDAEGELRAGRPAGAFGPSAVAHHIARRPFLVGEGGRWVDAQRERLRGILVRALECRGEVFLWNREILLAIEAAKEAIALEPFRETAHQLLIRGHAALGNAADAQRAYYHCREILAARLGIEPSSQTDRVYQTALGGGSAGATAIDSPATVAPQTLRLSGDLRADLQRLLGDAYRIDEELGGGGMSRVFLAEERALSRQVVIKVLSPDKEETFSADRFAREVRLAAKLQQANIVPLLSAAVVGGIPYYTMPFISGRSLREVLSQGTALPISSVVSILRDVGRALAFAHMHGIVHRDIKPENILLSGATAVVTDFGIAKAVEAAAATMAETSVLLTRFGMRVGTPRYMAPEQIASDPTIDHRADIYSYGIVGYELLAGRSPFAERNAQAALAAHLAEQPRDVREPRMDTPQPLADLVMCCIKKDRHLRPQSMAEVLTALEEVGRPTSI
jgi:DNA-binding SARP family transcriptional activator/predicted Ser/Thr protein kinase